MSNGAYHGPLERIDQFCWRIPRSYKPGMRVDGKIFASHAMIEAIVADKAPEQVANVATLPGIRGASLAMPDIHWGYGFCIGGVCATDPDHGGVISPGGVGYDINCGVRLVRSDLSYRNDVAPRIHDLVDALFRRVPAGVGRSGPFRFDRKTIRPLLADGPRAIRKLDAVTDRDLEFTEAEGRLDGADPAAPSARAIERGLDQCGTLGGGNHFLEVQCVDEIFDREAADAMRLAVGQVCVMIHSGSRGLGYQVCDDTLRSYRKVPERYGIQLPDRQLACAPIRSAEGKHYLAAMRAAANFAWCNRQLLLKEARESFQEVFGRSCGLELVYDVAHNIAKEEMHHVDGERVRVCVHRKGATRAFPPGHPELPVAYKHIGQPVIVPGDMGRASYLLVGRPGSMERTFGSACHGAGRALSRSAATRRAKGRDIRRELLGRNVVARARSRKGLVEEMPEAYKDVSQVVDVVARSGIAAKVARLRPVGVIKG
ncbi:MAG: RtcB family protein [Planctomycetota bacterium]|jgi:tRNA-splicing ligase RtcB